MSSMIENTKPESADNLLAGYCPPKGGCDEVLSADGRLRDPWPRFIEQMEGQGSAGLSERRDRARNLLRENGVTYNVYGAPQGPDRPWELDPLPVLMNQEEWQRLASGIQQRASLLNEILIDIYGPQQLARRKILPPELLFDHPGFLLPCYGCPVPNQIYLHLYACHLVRTSEDSWTVVADRTQGPSGAGYAVENRVIMSRVLPYNFQSLYVDRLAPFFIALRDTLSSLALHHRENPRVVLLSPGSRSSAYFEDGFLARYLGFPLVEGGDLTVRGNQVRLKTLGGLLPVDVILRRVPDYESDPLELASDSQLGVPGLLQSVRDGQVVVANALGSGYLESPALMAFLADACRELRGEDLLLPSIDVWWCGRPDHLSHVETHLDKLIIRPAYRHRSEAPIAGWKLTADQRRDLISKIRKTPGQYVGQARVERSTAPVWNGTRLEPWRVSLRTFAVAHGGEYRIMPGALSRLSPTEGLGDDSMSSGKVSKDLWVLTTQPVETVTLLKPPAAAIQLRRSGTDLPSRAAENLFWLGRLAERAECIVRHLRSVIVRLTSEAAPGSPLEASRLIDAMTESGQHPSHLDAHSDATVERVRAEAVAIIFDEKRTSGLFHTLEALLQTGGAVRDRLSIDSWRVVNQLNPATLFPWDREHVRPGELLVLLNQLINLLLSFSGLATESMTRGHGWRFLDIGRRIERALQTLRLVKNMFVVESGEIVGSLEALLEIAYSTMTYRYRYNTSLQLAPVLDLILVDETNPRAVGFQLAALAEHVKNLPGDPSDADQRVERRIVMAAQAELRLCDVDAFSIPDANTGRRQALHDFLETQSEYLRRLSDALTQRYLAHTGPSRQLAISPSPPEAP